MARMQCTYIDLAAAITVWAVDTHSIYNVQKVCIYACSCTYSTSACILSLYNVSGNVLCLWSFI